MERLRDASPAAGSPEATLADVVGAALPVAPTAVRQQRILQAVYERRRTRGFNWAVLLRPVMAVGILLLAGVAAAAATLGHDFIARSWRRLTEAPAVEVASAPPARARTHAPAAPALAPAASDDPAADALAPPPSPAARSIPRAAGRTRLAANKDRGGEDPSRVVNAIRALRTDRNPARASRLLAEYLKAYPHGALTEEALALSIEAAADRQSPQAVSFAEQYLRVYPNGRFRKAAEQAINRQLDRQSDRQRDL